ncbi:MAG TPA: saccharopine dehydrogenase C-terminal domain-containing protein [Gammaproteobacteria bacterium]|nr:saccharopine dehydrogenase C-terminal domain-containing protein [Gammaproteobacteria bacterium]
MHRVLVFGAGKIGSLIATLLSHSGDYRVCLADMHVDTPYLQHLFAKTPNLERVSLNAQNSKEISEFLRKNPVDTVISSLPFYCNSAIAHLAKEFDLNYFDLTEDTKTAQLVTELSKNAKNVFVPQCGLAPGFISIVTNELMGHFPTVDTVKMRVGALPINISNALQYSLTWSTDGLINEYGNMCRAIMEGKEIQLMPLDDLEEIKIDGLTYEAFNTSGGIGSLADAWKNKVNTMSYKTIRYPGHCEKMRFLMNDLKLNEDRETLKRILEKAIPKTGQDVVLVYVSVTGMQHGSYSEESYVRKFFPKTLHGVQWSAIQLTTASALCAVMDIIMTEPQKYHGLVKQEQFSLNDISGNRFGHYYA